MKLTNPSLPSGPRSRPHSRARGFSLLELAVSAAVMLVVVGAAVSYITLATQRTKVEQTKVDLTQEGRSFVDEFERDFHQSGYPSCAVFYNPAGCNLSSSNVAAGLVLASNTRVIFEGDIDGTGVIQSVQYRVVDSAGNFPPAGTCPCTIQRSQIPKVNLVAPTAQVPIFSQELQNVVNSGVPAVGATYGNGLNIAGNVLFAGGAITNDAYYAAVTTFKDFPVFSYFDQNGQWPTVGGIQIALPVDDSTAAGQAALAQIKSVRLTINLLGSGNTGYDIKNGTRPVATLVGNARRNN